MCYAALYLALACVAFASGDDMQTKLLESQHSKPPDATLEMAASTAACAVLAEREAQGDTLLSFSIVNADVESQDKECCAACAAKAACDFWVRDTNGRQCHLRHGWKGNKVNTGRRSGFKGQHANLCKVVKLVYGVVGAVIKRIPINLGNVIRNLHTELPNTIQCVLVGPESYFRPSYFSIIADMTTT